MFYLLHNHCSFKSTMWQDKGLPARHLPYLPVTCPALTGDAGFSVKVDYLKLSQIDEAYHLVETAAQDARLNVGCDEFPEKEDFLQLLEMSKVFVVHREGKGDV